MNKEGKRTFRAGRAASGPGLATCLGGIVLAAVLAIGVCAGWEQLSHARLAAEGTTARADAAAAALGVLAARFVEDGDFAGLQRHASALARRAGAEEATIELGDGQVLFDLRGQRQAITEIPETWTTLPTTAPTPANAGLAVHRTAVAKRGDLVVTVELPHTGAVLDLEALAAPGGAILVLVAAAGWLAVRALRLALPLRHISEALAAAAAGERCIDALGVSERWGAAAAAWNVLLADRERLRGEVLDELMTEVSGAGAGDSLAQRACDTFPSGVLLLDGAGTVRYANGAAAMLLGASREELAGRPLPEVLDAGSVCDQIEAVLTGGNRRRVVTEGERRVGDNRSILRFTALRMGSQEADAVMVIIDDVTQQRTADAARDAFVAQATHELRTPLTNIRLYLEMLLEGESDAAEQERSLNVISQEARRLERMVGDMLSVAEIEAGSLKMHLDDVRLEPLMAELEVDYRAQAEETNVALTFDLPPKLPVIHGDRDKIALLLHNLIANALKYTPAGGTVTVSAEDREDMFVVRVSDTGLGIAPEERERVFQKFYRARDERIAAIPGTGLGLSLARDVARLHGGDIALDSELNGGSTFTVTLPVRAKAA